MAKCFQLLRVACTEEYLNYFNCDGRRATNETTTAPDCYCSFLSISLSEDLSNTAKILQSSLVIVLLKILLFIYIQVVSFLRHIVKSYTHTLELKPTPDLVFK